MGSMDAGRVEFPTEAEIKKVIPKGREAYQELAASILYLCTTECTDVGRATEEIAERTRADALYGSVTALLEAHKNGALEPPLTTELADLLERANDSLVQNYDYDNGNAHLVNSEADYDNGISLLTAIYDYGMRATGGDYTTGADLR